MADQTSSGRKNTPTRPGRIHYIGQPKGSGVQAQHEEARALLKEIQDKEPLRVREPVIFRAKDRA